MADEALIAAIARLRTESRTTLTAKEVHAALRTEPEWTDLELSPVKRACSKVMKRGLVHAAPSVHMPDPMESLSARAQTCLRGRFASGADAFSEELCNFIASSDDWNAVRQCLNWVSQLIDRPSSRHCVADRLDAFHFAKLISQRGDPSLVCTTWELLRQLVHMFDDSQLKRSIWLRESCTTAANDGLLGVDASSVLRLFAPSADMGVITVTYSLAEVKGMSGRSFSHLMCCPHQEGGMPDMSLARGMFVHVTTEVTKGGTQQALMRCESGLTDRTACEEFKENDWTELIELAGSASIAERDVAAYQRRHEAIAGWKRARTLQMLGEADRNEELTTAALQASPLCARAHHHAMKLCLLKHSDISEVRRMADAAVRAGQSAMELVNAYDVHRGNLYNWLPGRDYLRALLSHSFLLENAGNTKEAQATLNRLIGCDRLDHLGARMPLLRLVLRKYGLGSSELKAVLSAKYGFKESDLDADAMFAPFVYTRALDAFTRGRQNADDLLEAAIVRNSFVPALLLGWQLLNDGICQLMELGGPSEAAIYVKGNATYWSDEALQWLERVYCATCYTRNPTTQSDDPGVRVAVACELRGFQHQIRGHYTEALTAFTNAIEHSDPRSAQRVRCLHARALCHIKLQPPDLVSCIRELTELLDIDPRHRAGRFLRADMRSDLGEIQGAKDDYAYVLQHLDANASMAQQQLKALYRKCGEAEPDWLRTGGLAVGLADASKQSIDEFVAAGTRAMPDFRYQNRVSADGCCEQCQRKEIKLFNCSQCGAVRYCSKVCQKAHWKGGHREVCAHMALVGKRVTLHSLRTESLNGKCGQVQAFVRATGRVSVLLDDAHEPFAVKPINVCLYEKTTEAQSGERDGAI